MSYNINFENITQLGNISEIKESDKYLEIKTDNGFLNIFSYNKNILRVNMSFYKNKKYTTFSVIQNPSNLIDNDFFIENKTKILKLSGENFNLILNKLNSELIFETKNNIKILEDENGLGNSIIGTEINCYKKLNIDEKFIGLGEKTGDLNRRGKYFVNKNSDTFAYSIEQDPIYSSIPFFIGIHNGLTYGIFLDSTYTTSFDFGVSTNNNHFSFGVENGPINYYFIYGNNVEEIIKNYTWLTGRAPMPPLWSLGFHQSRYSYYPEFKLDEVVEGFINRDIPCDAIHFDIHYMEQFKAFTFDKNKFSNPKKTISKLLNNGIHTVPILDPGIKIEKGYHPYDEGLENDMFVKYINGKNYEGSVWPGVCHFPDFTNKNVRKWWQKLCSFYTNLGVEAFWNDMNEPAVWGQKFPANTLFDYEGEKVTFKKARNIYGLLMTKASYEGLQDSDKNKRFFVLTRAAYSGIQRYSAKWTGDNVATDEHMLLGVRLVNSLNISGVAFSGTDVGGFVSTEKDQTLYAKWIALGCFTPFFRSHKMINANNSEPWSYGEETEQIAKNYIELRYRLIPYLYTQFYFNYKTGAPINKAMPVLYTHESWAYEKTFQNQFLHGDSILVCPTNTYSEYFKAYLPNGNWFDFYTDKIYKGNAEYVFEIKKDRLPVFIKNGKIICLQEKCKNLTKSLPINLEIHIYSLNENANTIYYEDDGKTNDYKSNKYFLQEIKYDFLNNEIKFDIKNSIYKSRFKTYNIYIHNIKSLKELSINIPLINFTKKIELKQSKYKILKDIPNFDPFINKIESDIEVDVLFGQVKI